MSPRDWFISIYVVAEPKHSGTMAMGITRLELARPRRYPLRQHPLIAEKISMMHVEVLTSVVDQIIN